jgi:hypothetical protein
MHVTLLLSGFQVPVLNARGLHQSVCHEFCSSYSYRRRRGASIQNHRHHWYVLVPIWTAKWKSDALLNVYGWSSRHCAQIQLYLINVKKKYIHIYTHTHIFIICSP